MRFPIFMIFFPFSLTWDHVGPTIQQRYANKQQPKIFKLLKFLLSGSHKSTFCDFWNFANLNFNDFFPVVLSLKPCESENFKTPVLLQNGFELRAIPISPLHHMRKPNIWKKEAS